MKMLIVIQGKDKMFGYFFRSITLIFIISIASCQSKPDYEQIRMQIMELHQKTIDAHLNKDVEFFVQDLSENFLSVSNGDIDRPTREDIRSRFDTYLNSTQFSEYRDLQEPIIGISEDGTLAWSIVQVKVTGDRRLSDEQSRKLDFIAAWITLYKKQDGNWVRIVEVSNFK